MRLAGSKTEDAGSDGEEDNDDEDGNGAGLGKSLASLKKKMTRRRELM